MVYKTVTARLVFFFLLSVLLSGQAAAQDSTFRGEKIRFQTEVAKFLTDDSLQPPPKQSILFIGSSIFRQWTSLRQDMSPLPVFNRAFGGSRTNDILYYMDKIVIPYEPKLIFYYCGSNDAGGSVPAEKVVRNIKEFFERVESSLPETKIFFVSVNRSPARIAKWPGIDSINAMIGEFCRQSALRQYIDVNAALFDSNGTPRYELYLDDRLHFKKESYAEFTKIIKPILTKEWNAISAEKKE